MPPLTAEELQQHPEYEHTVWNLKPDRRGKAVVAKDRGGPINIAYEVHGHGDRKIVVSMLLLVFFNHPHVSSFCLASYMCCGYRCPVKFRFGRMDRLSLQPCLSLSIAITAQHHSPCRALPYPLYLPYQDAHSPSIC